MKVVCFALVLIAVVADTVCKFVKGEATQDRLQCLPSEEAVCAVLAKAECDANAACIHNEDNGPGCRTKVADAYMTAFMASDCVGINEADCKAKTDTCISVSASSCVLSKDYVESKCLSEKTEEDCAGVAAAADSPCKWVDDYSNWHEWCFTSQRFICHALSKEACESNADCFSEEETWGEHGLPWHCVAMADHTAWNLDQADPVCFADKDDCGALAGCTWVEEHEACYTNAFVLTDDLKCDVSDTNKETCEAPAALTTRLSTTSTAASTTPISTASTTESDVIAVVADAACKWIAPLATTEVWDHQCFTLQGAMCSAFAKDACEKNTGCFLQEETWNTDSLENDPWICLSMAGHTAFVTDAEDPVCFADEDDCKSNEGALAGCTWVEEHEACYTNAYVLTDDLKCDVLYTKDTCEAPAALTTPASTVSTSESDETSNAVNAMALSTILLTAGLIL